MSRSTSLSAGASIWGWARVSIEYGWDITFLGSAPIHDKLELYGALDIAFNRFDDDVADDSFTWVHLVPGIQGTRSRRILDLVAEVGIGLNDDSANYFSAGIAFYIR